MNEPHRWRSAQLGESHLLTLPQGTVEYFRRGSGRPLVFAHGWLANANLWRHVIDQLADRFDCIALDLPLGAHRIGLNDEADLGAEGCGALISDILGALALDDAVLIGNDSGGAYSQIALADGAVGVTGLALTSCETPYDEFPPKPFDGLPEVARDPTALRQLLGTLEDPEVRKQPAAFGLLVKHRLDQSASDSYALPCALDADVLQDTAKVMSGASTEAVHRAGAALIERWNAPATLIWSSEDPVFPIDHARRYAEALPNAGIVEIEDSYSFTPEDQPEAVAKALAGFAAG
jgi:pimeloyl-ACP methyl ester carboxylesterase